MQNHLVNEPFIFVKMIAVFKTRNILARKPHRCMYMCYDFLINVDKTERDHSVAQ